MDGWMVLIRVKVRVMFECDQLWVGGLCVRYPTNAVHCIVCVCVCVCVLGGGGGILYL